MLSRIGRKIGGILFVISFIYLIGMAGADDVAGGPVSSIFAKGLIAVAGMAVGAVLIAAGGEENEDTFKYVSMVEDLISIRDGEIIDEI